MHVASYEQVADIFYKRLG